MKKLLLFLLPTALVTQTGFAQINIDTSRFVRENRQLYSVVSVNESIEDATAIKASIVFLNRVFPLINQDL